VIETPFLLDASTERRSMLSTSSNSSVTFPLSYSTNSMPAHIWLKRFLALAFLATSNCLAGVVHTSSSTIHRVLFMSW